MARNGSKKYVPKTSKGRLKSANGLPGVLALLVQGFQYQLWCSVCHIDVLYICKEGEENSD